MSHNSKLDKIFLLFKKIFKNRSKQLHTPAFTNKEYKNLRLCIKSTYVSYVGNFVKKFEKKINKYTGSNFSVAVNSGTSALHLILNYLNVSKNNEILIPSLTYVATANAVRYCQAEVNFVDIETDTLGVCPKKLENYLRKITILKNGRTFNKKSGKEIKALIVVHLYGFPAKILELKKICQKYKLILIEDAAEALGSFYKKKHLGTIGDYGILSFNGNKIITTGGGGMILCKKKSQEKYFRHVSTHAKLNIKNDHIHDKVGFNYRMINLSAAVGCAQLDEIKNILKSKRYNFNFYQKIIKSSKYFEILKEPKNSKINFWLITALFKSKRDKDAFIKKMNSIGLGLRNIWRPLHTLKIYNNCQSDDLSNSKYIFERSLNLPSSPYLFKK